MILYFLLYNLLYILLFLLYKIYFFIIIATVPFHVEFVVLPYESDVIDNSYVRKFTISDSVLVLYIIGLCHDVGLCRYDHVYHVSYFILPERAVCKINAVLGFRIHFDF